MKINRQRFDSTEIFIFIEKIEILQRILVLFIEFHNRQQLSRRYKFFFIMKLDFEKQIVATFDAQFEICVSSSSNESEFFFTSLMR